MDYQSVCDTLRKTYNINFLDLDENKIIGQEFAKTAEIYRDSKKGNKVLIDLIYNHYNVKKPFPDFIGGPQTLTMHWSNRWKKLIYIFGEQHSNEIDCEKRLNTKKWVPIQNFLEDLILKTDVYLDIYFEFPAIQKSERRYYDSFKPFPTDSRMDTLFKRFKKYVQPGTKNDEDLVRVHYFDSRVEDHEGKRVGVCDVNWFEIKTLDFTQLNLVYNLKELVRDNSRFQYVLKSLGVEDDELFINFWMKQYKENKYNASALLNCPVQAEILKFIEDELRLELKSDDFVQLRNMLIKYIPYILSDTLEDDSIVPFFEFIIKSINVPKAFIADVYTLASIFKDFENVTKQPSQQNSVIIYGGNAHSEIYRKFLKYISFEELIIQGNPSDPKSTCVDMKKLDKPFFSDWSMINITDLIINLDSNDGYKINSVSGNISLIYQGNKIPCIIQTIESEISIRIFGLGKNVCLDLAINNAEKIANLHTIDVDGNECPLSMSSQGSFLLHLVDEICIQLGVTTVKLTDDSHITCDGEQVSLEFRSLMKHGKSWYEIHGFSYENKEKKDIINNIRNTSVNKITKYLSTFDTNKKLKLKTQWTQEALERLYIIYPELKNQDYLNSLKENSYEKKLYKKIMEEDYSELPNKIKKFLRIISEYKKEYNKDTLGEFLTYLWYKNCSDYIEIVSFLYPKIDRQLDGYRGNMYIERGVLPEFPNEEEDSYMIKFLPSATHHKSLYMREISKSKTYTDLEPLKAADFGCTLPTADTILKGKEGQRQLILLETLKKFEEYGFRYHQLAFENLSRWASEAVQQSPTRKCVVIVKPGDWGEVTHDMTKKYGVCFASLNMANAYGPGGGYTDGMVAQEENMFRRTDCHFAIVRKTLMRSDGSEEYTSDQSDLINGVNGRVYLDTDHPRVCIRGPENRDSRNLGYEWLSDDNIFPFYELRSAAVDLRSGEEYNHKETRKRVAAQLDTLIEAGVRHVVLSAFGCGAFMNPATHVASAYHEALKERKMHFDVVAFGIFNAGYGPNNFAPFEEEFKSWKV